MFLFASQKLDLQRGENHGAYNGKVQLSLTLTPSAAALKGFSIGKGPFIFWKKEIPESTLPKTKIATVKRPFAPKGKACLSSIIFQGLLLSVFGRVRVYIFSGSSHLKGGSWRFLWDSHGCQMLRVWQSQTLTSNCLSKILLQDIMPLQFWKKNTNTVSQVVIKFQDQTTTSNIHWPR